jgi:8-hydroxy-5-deazaflavin:NADPH oxidoreductase
MKYAIIGSGQIGTALARAFARKNIEVAIANTRGPEALASLTKELGRSVVPQSIQDAYKACSRSATAGGAGDRVPPHGVV